MASMYEIKTFEYLDVPYCEYMSMTGISSDSSLTDMAKAWEGFAGKYKDINWSSVGKFSGSSDVVSFSGPRPTLLELKYDLEKKKYG